MLRLSHLWSAESMFALWRSGLGRLTWGLVRVY